MPVVQRRPRGRSTRTFVEGYHFGPLWSRRRVVRFNMDVPVVQSATNLPYVDIKGGFNRTATSLSVHESRVHIGQDLFLVSGYWDPKADVNRSVFAVMKVLWRGEISVIRAGRYVPYSKRMKDGKKADLAVKHFAQIFKHRRAAKRLVPKTILG